MATPPEIPHLSEGYAKAHRAYGLTAGILLASELVGIEFAAAPIDNINITLKSPAALPYVLVALVGYFAIRFSIEWRHCDQRRRSTAPAKFDYRFAHLIGGTGFGLFLYQSALRVQLFTQVGAMKFMVVVVALFLLIQSFDFLLLPGYREPRRRRLKRFAVGLTLLGAACGLAFFVGGWLAVPVPPVVLLIANLEFNRVERRRLTARPLNRDGVDLDAK